MANVKTDPEARAKDSPQPASSAKSPRGGSPDPPKRASPPPPQSHPMRWIAAIVVLLAIGGSVAGYFYRSHEQQLAKERLELAGNIDVRQVNLAFKVEGRIVELAVDEGDTVEPGQVLATLDQRYFEDDLRLARARRDSTAANLARLENGSRPEEIAESRAKVAEAAAAQARARQDFERAKSLVNSGAVSKETFDQAKAALDEAEARREALTKACNSSRLARGRRTSTPRGRS